MHVILQKRIIDVGFKRKGKEKRGNKKFTTLIRNTIFSITNEGIDDVNVFQNHNDSVEFLSI